MAAYGRNEVANSDVSSALDVLVLDDDQFDRTRVGRWLRTGARREVRMHEASDLAAFDAALRKRRFDLVLIDFCLADGDGLAAMDLLADAPLNAESFVVMISGQESEGHRAQSLSRGCDRYIPKSGLSAAVILQILSEACGLLSTQQAANALPQISAMAFWAQRAKRRGVAAQAMTTVSSSFPVMPPEQVGNANQAPTSAWEAWAGAGEFFADFLAVDEFIFD